MTISAAVYAFTATVSTTEYSCTANSTSIQTRTTPGVYQLAVDGIANMVAGDEYEIAVQEKVISGGTQRRTVLGVLNGPQGEIWYSAPLTLGVGWDFTLKRLAGADRSLSWSVRGVT